MNDGSLADRASAADARALDASDARELDAAASDAAEAMDARELDATRMDPPDSATIADTGVRADVPSPAPCTTRITYGNRWIHGPSHPANYDDADGVVSWDGRCIDDGGNSYAVLSNGWRPYFTGNSACVIALDYRGACSGVPSRCETRVAYGPAWDAPASHPNRFDDVGGAVSWDGICRNDGARSFATLSNGWTPYFSGNNRCSLGLRYTQCGGLYDNPVVPTDCPDPGVAQDGDRYVMACTGGGANAYPIRTSTDLVNWTFRGHIFPSADKPTWSTGDYWAPEIHRVGTRWIAYFSARHRDGSLAVGAAIGTSPLGPFRDLGRPLVHDPNPGVIDVHFFEAPDGARYLLWKLDGNAVRARTPIYIQRLAADGVTLMGTRTTLITNDRAWEGALVEGPWMIFEGGMYYLFYSANGYASNAYAVGVARSSSPTGPFTKAAAPILVTKGAWAGPGHGSIVRGPSGDWVHVYHAWVAGSVGQAPGRQVLVDRITFNGGWPQMLAAPSSRSQPMP